MTTEIKNGTRIRPERGVAMIIALFTVVIILAVSLALLTHTVNAAASAGGVEDKGAAFNAAEAGINQAIDALDANANATTCPSPGGTVNGVAFNCVIQKNNFGGSGPVSVVDPATGGSVAVPAGWAYVYGNVPSSGKHPTYAEAIAAPRLSTTSFGSGVSGANDVYDSCNANALLQTDIYANDQIFISGPGLVAHGYTYGYNGDQLKGCNTPGCTSNPYNSTHHTPPDPNKRVTLPSPSQALAIQTELQNIADTGGTPQSLDQWCPSFPCSLNGNVHITGDVKLLSSQTLTFTGNGTIYVDGNVVISGAIINQGSQGSTIGVGGTFSTSGSGTYCGTSTDCSNTTPNQGELIVFSQDAGGCNSSSPGGCALSLTGNSQPVGFTYTPFGSSVIGGNGNQTGSVNAGTTPAQSGGNVFFHGCGSNGGFTGFSGPTHIITHEWHITAYWEY